MSTERKWNPRFVRYAEAHGRTPEQMLEHDREAWPGGKMVGFMLWIQGRWSEWRAANRLRANDVLGPADHAAFDEWLRTRAQQPEQAELAL